MSSLGSQGSMNQGKLDKQPSKAPEKSQENIRPDDSLIPAGSISSDSTNQKLEPVGSDSAACSVDRIQSYIKNKCPDVYRYSSSIADYTDTRTKLCVEEIGIDPDRSCSTLESDFERLKNCEVFCNLICLPGKNRPENSEILPDDCKVPTTPITTNTSPMSTTKVTTSTTTNAATESDSGNTLAIGLGAGLGGLLLIVLVILGIYCFKNRKRGEILEYYKPFQVLLFLNLDFSPKDT